MDKLIIDGIEVEIHRNYFPSGKIQKEWTQTEYELHGYSKEFYENGNLKIHDEYRNNTRHLISTHWYNNGKKKKEIINQNGIYFRQDYFESGNLKLRAKVSKNLNFNGESISYFENGNVSYKEFYDESGQNVGEMSSFFEDGNPSLFGKYQNGNLIRLNQWNNEHVQIIKDGNGIIELKDENNIIIRKEKYLNGVLDGECISYKNGIITSSINYKNGKADGKSLNYYDNGKIKEILTWKNGEIIDELRNLPKYENPKLESSVSVFLAEKRDTNNVLLKQLTPVIENTDFIFNHFLATDEEFKKYNNDYTLTGVYIVKVNSLGKIKEFSKSSGSIYPTLKIEKTLSEIKFDINTIEDIDGEIWLKFDFKLKNDSN